uniref:Vacuolar protein sorting-associated protein 11 homolog n=1 Tax=Haemonchus contortus TaxID=6289 RepID=A0A7I4YPJ2_HAECO
SECKSLMSVDFGWRRFNFFDKNIVQDPENPDEKFLGLKDVCVDCWCSNISGEAAYLGEQRGGVFRLGRDLNENYWKAYQTSLTALHVADDFIFSIGEDEEGVNSLLKIWKGDCFEKGVPALCREVRISTIHPSSHYSVTACAVAVHSSLSAIAIGFVDGTVLLYQGTVIKDKALTSRWQRIRDPLPLDGTVSGLALAQLPGEKLVVFVITTKVVNSYVIENKTVVNSLKHDSNGTSKDCWTFDERTGSLVVASRDMVYFYEADQCLDADGYRGRCLQLGRSHEKLQLISIGDHLVLVTKQHALIPSSDETEYMSMVTVYNVKGQYIGFSCSVPSLCRLFTVDQSLMILGKDGTLSKLTEKSLNAKLDILFKKNLYDVAIILAKNNKDGAEHLKAIHAKYGDYLYGKADFDGAINEYKETIGMLEPSYVIKRYLEGSRLRQLCVYMEALHETNRYNLHHTSILLHCYAQLEEREKMMKFLEKISKDRKTDMAAVFDVLRSLKLSEDASLFAVKLGMHDYALSMMVEDLGRHAVAIKYISKRTPAETCSFIEKYGHLLFEACPNETVDLLQDVIEKSSGDDVDPTQLLKVFVGDFTKAAGFVEFALKKVSGPSRAVLLDTILELRLRDYSEGKITDDECCKQLIPFIEDGNISRALNMARLFHCAPVMQHILQKLGRKKELLQYYLEGNKLFEAIDLCNTEKSKEMWLDTLVHVSKVEGAVDESLIIKLLEGIEANGTLQPLVVLEILSRSSTLKVASVKDYVIRWLDAQRKQIEADRKAIADGERRVEEIDKQMESLKFNVQVLQVNKCSACDTALQLPAVHFLCRHSYHVHCFESYSDRPDVCPACVGPMARETSRESISDKAAYQMFHKELNGAVNGLEVISRYIRSGVFDMSKKNSQKKGSTAVSPADSNKGDGNPFENDDDLNPFADRSTLSTKSSDSTGRRISSTKAPSVNRPSAYDDSKNPFKVGTNPFEE